MLGKLLLALALASAVNPEESLRKAMHLRPDQTAAYDDWRSAIRTAEQPDTEVAKTEYRTAARTSLLAVSSLTLERLRKEEATAATLESKLKKLWQLLDQGQRQTLTSKIFPDRVLRELPPAQLLTEDSSEQESRAIRGVITNPGLSSAAKLTSLPDEDTLSAYYPLGAVKKNEEGRVQLHCTVPTNGVIMDCSVVSETPAGAGFGNAAIQLASYLHASPTILHGSPVVGEIWPSFTFKLPPPDAP